MLHGVLPFLLRVITGKSYPTSFLKLGRFLCQFVQDLCADGEPKGYASDAFSGIGNFIPACKPHMIAAWRLHAAWGRAELPCRAPPFTPFTPFTPLLLYALAQAAFNGGWRETTVLLILGFHTFARSGELLRARCKDFVLSATSGTWTLPFSKSGQRTGNVESILLHDRFVCVAV